MELEPDQMTALRTGSRQIRRVAALLRSINPESSKDADHALWICDQAWNDRADQPTVEEVVRGFAGMLRYCPTLGPGAQEMLQRNLERLIERMGLAQAVRHAVEAPLQDARSLPLCAGPGWSVRLIPS
jgi:hypothetical protein